MTTNRVAAVGFSKAVYLGFVVDKDMEKELPKLDPLPALQTQRFGLLLIDLLNEIASQVVAVSFVQIQNYPLGRKIIFYKRRSLYRNTLIHCLGFINILILKHISRLAVLFLNSRIFCKTDLVMVHGVHLPNIIFALTRKSLGAKIVLVLTDAPGVVLDTDNKHSIFLKRVDQRFSRSLIKKFDFVIALSPALCSMCSTKQKVFYLPGIYNEKLEYQFENSAINHTTNKFIVLYFGGLEFDYGIDLILDAVPLFSKNIEIRIFGRGSYSEKIEKMARVEKNLFYGGFVNQETLVEEMKKCNTLINPRPSTSKMANYSSASKFFEYVASGKPVLTTRLPSLDNDIEKFLYFIDQETPQGVADAVNLLAKSDRTERCRRGRDLRASLKRNYSISGIANRFLDKIA